VATPEGVDDSVWQDAPERIRSNQRDVAAVFFLQPGENLRLFL
jgi:hypothetical protein